MHPNPEPAERSARVQAYSRRLLAMIDRSFLHEIQQTGLEGIVELTGSRNGYLFVRESAPSTLRIHNVVAPGANTAPAVQEDGEDLARDGYWSACLAAGEAVIRNEPSAFDAPLTAAFEPMRRDLAVPVTDGGRIVAVLGVGNAPSDYDPAAAELVAELGRILWRVIVRKRLRDSIGGGAL